MASFRFNLALDVSGKRIPVEIWVGELTLGGEPGYVVVFHDISPRKIAEEELEQARQQIVHQEKMAAVGQLAAGILHEVNNPIAAISGAIEAIHLAHAHAPRTAERCDIFDGVNQHISLIESQVQRLGSITREIADFAQPRPKERELLDLNGLLQSTANLMRYDRRFRNVAFEIELDRNVPAIEGVADQLTQVVMNLLINAVDACEMVPERESLIRLRSACEDDRVHVIVSDNGSGMDAETATRATEAFYTTKPVGKGTGLGLSLCNTVIEESHGGQLRIETEPGVGTTMHIYLPMAKL